MEQTLYCIKRHLTSLEMSLGEEPHLYFPRKRRRTDESRATRGSSSTEGAAREQQSEHQVPRAERGADLLTPVDQSVHSTLNVIGDCHPTLASAIRSDHLQM